MLRSWPSTRFWIQTSFSENLEVSVLVYAPAAAAAFSLILEALLLFSSVVWSFLKMYLGVVLFSCIFKSGKFYVLLIYFAVPGIEARISHTLIKHCVPEL